MVNCQAARGKRRRSGPLEDQGSPKKPRHDESEAVDGTSLGSEVENKNENTKKRVALRTPSSPLTHLFVTRDEDGTPQAAYVDVIKAIGLTEQEWLKAASLQSRAVESISNITDIFRIEKSQEGKLMLKYKPVDWNKEECTVYLDNLPEGCTSEKISRIARKFGTVVEVRLPRSSSRKVHSPYGLLEVGRHPRSFAFVQFTEPAACDSMCSAFAHNFPSCEKKKKSESLVPLLQRLLMRIRILSKRHRRRTYAQNLLLMKLRREQAAIIKKERTANKRTCRLSRSVEHGTNSVSMDQEEGKIPHNNHNDGQHNTCPECGDSGSRRPSFVKRKRLKAHSSKSLIKTSNRKKRKRRRRRKAEVGPHTIVGSVSDYFSRIQVLPL
ncbi:hypothetical protein KIN20_015730 [Parelaphostrongylus tenuis]|uniref:RRM domain-containing protein n=1 Tax=Parelaphostrongylus tenuis TaxID=148309 RepID=A0AAD5MFD8_PARTN|nr:hypothetical protein KIN20_015730 [Parelaphostrongylus tenuis]